MILDDYEDEQIEQIIQVEKDKEQDEKIEELVSNISKNAGDISALKEVDDSVKEDLELFKKIIITGDNDKPGLINATKRALEGAAEALNRITKDGGIDARLDSNLGKINTVESDYKEADKKIVDDLSKEVVTETVVADTVTVNESLTVNGTAHIDNLTVESLVQNEITAISIETEDVKSDVADIDRLNVDTITVSDDDEWISSNRDLGNDKLWLLSIPKYDGNVQIVTRDDDLAITVINNTLVTFNQKSTYLFRVDFKKDSTDLYFNKAFPFKAIWYGDIEHSEIAPDTRDRTFYQNNVNSLTGVVSATEFQYGDGTNLQVIVVDELPEGGIKNVIYVVNGYKSFYCDGERMYPMTTEVTEDIDFGTLIGEEM